VETIEALRDAGRGSEAWKAAGISGPAPVTTATDMWYLAAEVRRLTRRYGIDEIHHGAKLTVAPDGRVIAEYPRYSGRPRPRIVNGRAALGYIPDDEAPRPAREYYPGVDGHWPKTQWRRLWLWAFRWRLSRRITRRPFNPDEEWGMHTFLDGKRVRSGGHHLPSMFRFDFGTHMYTRACVPVDEQLTRVVYYHAVRRRSALGRLAARLFFVTFQNWAMNANFSDQDYRVMAPQRYDTSEKLSVRHSNTSVPNFAERYCASAS